MNNRNDAPIYEFDNAIDYIAERCNIDRHAIEKVLLLNEDYMRSIGIIDELPESMVEDINKIIKQKNEKGNKSTTR